MRKYFVISSVILLVTALVLTGCVQQATVEPPSPTQAPTQPAASTDTEMSDWEQLPIWDTLSGELIHWNQSGGVVEETWREYRINPFEERTGVEVITEFYCCGLDRLQAQVNSGNVTWDIASIGTEGQLLQAVNEGLLETVDYDIVPGHLLPEQARRDHAIANEVYASVLAWNTDVFSGEDVPADATDIFDTERFPGKRCLMQNISLGGTFEVALLADGVPPDELYPLDVERALAKLNTIRDDIVWWSSGAESIQFILDGECDLGMTFNGRPYNAWREGAPVDVTWNNAVLNQSWLAPVAGAPNLVNAQAYLAWWLYNIDGMIRTAEVVGYINPREGVVDQVDPELRKWLPVGPNLEKGVWENAEYYAENSTELTERFNEWLVSGE